MQKQSKLSTTCGMNKSSQGVRSHGSFMSPAEPLKNIWRIRLDRYGSKSPGAANWIPSSRQSGSYWSSGLGRVPSLSGNASDRSDTPAAGLFSRDTWPHCVRFEFFRVPMYASNPAPEIAFRLTGGILAPSIIRGTNASSTPSAASNAIAADSMSSLPTASALKRLSAVISMLFSSWAAGLESVSMTIWSLRSRNMTGALSDSILDSWRLPVRLVFIHEPATREQDGKKAKLKTALDTFVKTSGLYAPSPILPM